MQAQPGLPDWKSEEMPNEVKKVPKKCQTHPEKRQKNAKAFLTNWPWGGAFFLCLPVPSWPTKLLCLAIIEQLQNLQ